MQRFRSQPSQLKANSPFVWPDFRAGRPEWQIIDYSAYTNEGFNLNSLVYSAIMYKVRALVQVPLIAYTGDIDRREQLPIDHPLQQLVFRPNPHQSFPEFQALCMTYWNLSGNNYIMMARPKEGGLPESMYSLRPDRVFIVPGKDKDVSGIQGFLYVPEGRSKWLKSGQSERSRMLREDEAILILPEDMMHTKLPNPGDPLEGLGYGLSPLSPGARTVDIDNKVTHFLKLFFDGGTMFQGLLSFEAKITPGVLQQIKERWKEQYGGYQNWDDIGVLDQGASFQRISPTFDEMGFKDIDERNETRSIMVWGVPPILIGSRAGLATASYSNYKNAREACWDDTLVPETRWWEADYQYFLHDDDAFVAYDYSAVPALKEKVQSLVESWVSLVQNGVPKNIAGDLLGLPLPQLSDGDVVYMPLNMVPVGGSRPSVPSPIPEEDDDVMEAETDDRMDETDKSKKKGLSQEAKYNTWKRVDSIAESWEKAFNRVGKQQFEIDLENILEIVKEKAKPIKATIDWQTVLKSWQWYLSNAAMGRWREAFVPVIQGVILDQGSAWNLQFGQEFDITNLFATEWFKNYVLKFAQPIMDTTERELSILLRQAQESGWSIPTTSRHIKTLFRQWMDGDLTTEQFEWFEQRMPPHRLEMISRTETLRSSNAGSSALFEAWNITGLRREWLATFDNRVRASHALAGTQYVDGGTPGPIPLGEPFIVGGEELMYPGDPNGSAGNTILCRCTESPWIPGIF